MAKAKGKKKTKSKKDRKNKAGKFLASNYFERKGPIWNGTYEFRGKVGQEAVTAFSLQAAQIREKIKFERDHSVVCLHVRQVEIEAHDFHITLHKSCPLERLQSEIALRQHNGSVRPEDVAIYKPSPALEKIVKFGKLSHFENLKNQSKQKPPEAPQKSEISSAENSAKVLAQLIEVSQQSKLATEDISEDVEYFKNYEEPLSSCFPGVSEYEGGNTIFHFNKGNEVTICTEEKVEIPPSATEKKYSGKSKKKRKPEEPKTTKWVPPKFKITRFIPPTPIDVYYDIIPYVELLPAVRREQENDFNRRSLTNLSAKSKAAIMDEPHRIASSQRMNLPAKSRAMSYFSGEPIPVAHKTLNAKPLANLTYRTVSSTKCRPATASTIDTKCPILLTPQTAPPSLYGLHVGTTSSPQATLSVNQARRSDSFTHSPLSPRMNTARREAQLFEKHEALTHRGIIGTEITRPKTAPATVTTSTTWRNGNSIPWDQRWMAAWRDMGARYEWDTLISDSRCESEILAEELSDGGLWEEVDDELQTVNLRMEQHRMAWRLERRELGPESARFRAETLARIGSKRASEADAKQSKKQGKKSRGKKTGKKKVK
ncbi:hypothetical protein HDU84_001132 [Entophlyctis sp. JEL0112]|nr:hypothetical protein HDU84_001132 [Entophlyctis sp. JEL0112]